LLQKFLLYNGVVASNLKDLVECADELNEVCKEAGLKINVEKTKILSNARKEKVVIADEVIKWVNEFKYLGRVISFVNKRDRELSSRIRGGWKNFWSS